MKVKPRYTAIILSLGLILGLGLGKLTLEPELIVEREIVTHTEIVEVEKELVKYKVLDAQELLNFMRLVESEATSGRLDQKLNVAHVILNRVSSESFPNTINKVIFQDGQFSPISNKRFYSIKVSDDTAKAVTMALGGENRHSSLYFMVRRWSGENNVKWFDRQLTFTFNDGLHEYFKE